MFEREVNRDGVTEAEIVVVIPAYNEADSIAHPTRVVSEGLRRYFPDRSSVIINADNDSPDATEEVFLATETEVPKIYITTPENTPGKGWNFVNAFRRVYGLGAQAVVCVDADLISITPEWIDYMATPILEHGLDYLTPLYSRHKYDGTITNNICYPLIYGLFCRNIRQPIGGDFAMSRRFAEHLVKQPWHLTTEQYGVDIFMTMNAITGGFRICETGLGAKRHKPSAPKLGPMFIQVVGTAFLTVIRSFEQWKNRDTIDRPLLYGLRDLEPPQELDIDRSAIEKQAREGFAENRDLLKSVLTPELFDEYAAMFDGGEIDISAEQWVTAVYDMIAAFRVAPDRDALVESLKGLYFGRALAFMNKTWEMSTEEAEGEILAQAEVFHARRDYLIQKLEA